ATGPDLVEGDRRDVELVEADGGGQLGERIDLVGVHPPVAPFAVLGALLVGEHASFEVELRFVALDAGRLVGVLAGDARRPQIWRFHHVVVDRDDAGEISHVLKTRTRSSLPAMPTYNIVNPATEHVVGE